MNQQEKRIKIAEKCGAVWVWTRRFNDIPERLLTFPALYHEKHDYDKVEYEPITRSTELYLDDCIPNYFSSLDACHEMEKFLIAHGRANNAEHWMKVREYEERLKYGEESLEFHASESERAEAFGITMGLWKEGE